LNALLAETVGAATIGAMPIVDVEVVCDPEAAPPRIDMRRLADELGRVLGSPPGRTWVRLHLLSSAHYAENEAAALPAELPTFATVLRAQLPAEAELAAEAAAVTRTIASCVGRPFERVHVQYAPAAAGRQAFGGVLVR
jgi:phenylpyruvate tautomerase PptA (4-oxalocrotonate tautomerase family)